MQPMLQDKSGFTGLLYQRMKCLDLSGIYRIIPKQTFWGLLFIAIWAINYFQLSFQFTYHVTAHISTWWYKRTCTTADLIHIAHLLSQDENKYKDLSCRGHANLWSLCKASPQWFLPLRLPGQHSDGQLWTAVCVGLASFPAGLWSGERCCLTERPEPGHGENTCRAQVSMQSWGTFVAKTCGDMCH